MIKYVQSEVTRHGRTVYYYRAGNSPRIRLPDDYGSREFLDAVDLAKRSGAAVPRKPFERPSFEKTQRRRVGLALEVAVKGARKRAKAKDLPFDLDMDWVLAEVERLGFRCSLTGIAFYMPTTAVSFRHPFAPSLDQIKAGAGYTKENVRIVTFAVNIMLMDWGHEVFERVVSGYRFTKGTKNKLLFPATQESAGDKIKSHATSKT